MENLGFSTQPKELMCIHQDLVLLFLDLGGIPMHRTLRTSALQS
jgi:hypothetical protein